MNPSIWFGLVKEIKLSREVFHLPMMLWQKYGLPKGLQWHRVDFHEASKPSLPNKTGLYAMAICARNADFPPNSYLFYIGEVGATGGSGRTFRRRFQEYLDEYRTITRPKVAQFLHSYQGAIDFYYCELDHTTVDIKALEAELLTALLPIANSADIEPDIRKARRAFG